MDKNREVSYKILVDVLVGGAFASLAIKDRMKEDRIDIDENFVRKLVYGVLENNLLLEYIVSKVTGKKINKVKKKTLILIEMGIYQLRFLDSIPSYAAINETVMIAKKYLKSQVPFINGVLRGYEKKKEDIDLEEVKEDLEEYLSIKYSCNKEIIKLLLSQYPKEKVRDFLENSLKVPEVDIRVNISRISREKLKKELETSGYEVKENRYSDRSLRIKGNNLLETKAYKEGCFSIQSESSTYISDLFNDSTKEEELILDICAAPGGKTLAIAEKMDNKGKIIAFDIYDHRIDLIKKNAERLDIKNIETIKNSGENFLKEYEGKADKVLVDAPCSGLGVIGKKPEIKLKGSVKNYKELYSIQRKILETSSRYLKDDGLLVYSTCTLNKNENEGIIEEFLANNKDFTLEKMETLFMIDDSCDGFFYGILRKRKNMEEVR